MSEANHIAESKDPLFPYPSTGLSRNSHRNSPRTFVQQKSHQLSLMALCH